MQRGERIDTAVERLVPYAGRVEPIAHRMAADKARAYLIARELVESSSL
jgi:hypothetical protein